MLPLAAQGHAQLKQNLNRRKGNHDRLVRSYEKLRQDMQEVFIRGEAPVDVEIPGPLPRERLWDLDTDDDIWVDIARDAHVQGDDAPKWLCDQPTREGIRAMLELQRCEEEIERLNHERGTMFAWFRGQKEQLQCASCIAQGK